MKGMTQCMVVSGTDLFTSMTRYKKPLSFVNKMYLTNLDYVRQERVI